MAYVNYDPTLGMAAKQTSDWGPLSYREDQLRKSAGLDLMGRPVALQSMSSEPEYQIGSDGLPVIDQAGQPVMANSATPNLAYYSWLNGEVDPAYTQAQQAAQAKRDANQAYQQLGALEQYGLSYKNKALSSEANRETIAQRLGEYGVNNLQDLGSTTVDGKPVFYNRTTGQALPGELGYTSYGDGFTRYKLQAMPDGSALPVPAWEDSSDNGKIAQGLSIAAMLAAPWALPALGAATGLGAAASGALYGGATGALTSGIGGGNVLEGGLTGALAGGIGGAFGAGPGQFDVSQGLGGAAGKAINSAASGALTGGMKAGLSGQNILEGATMGGVAGGLGSYANSQLAGAGLGPKASGFLSSQLSGAARDQLGSMFGQNQPIMRRPSMGGGVKQAASSNPLSQLGSSSAPLAGGGKDWATFQQYLKTQGQLFGSGQQQPIRRPSMGGGIKQVAASPLAQLGNASAPSAGGSKDWSTFQQYLKTQGLA